MLAHKGPPAAQSAPASPGKRRRLRGVARECSSSSKAGALSAPTETTAFPPKEQSWAGGSATPVQPWAMTSPLVTVGAPSVRSAAFSRTHSLALLTESSTPALSSATVIVMNVPSPPSTM